MRRAVVMCVDPSGSRSRHGRDGGRRVGGGYECRGAIRERVPVRHERVWDSAGCSGRSKQARCVLGSAGYAASRSLRRSRVCGR